MLYKSLSLRSPGVLPLIAAHFNCNFCVIFFCTKPFSGEGGLYPPGMCSSRVEVQISLTMF